MTPRTQSAEVRFGVLALTWAARYALVLLAVLFGRLIGTVYFPRTSVPPTLLLVLSVIASAWIAGRVAGCLATLAAIAVTWKDSGQLHSPGRVALSLLVGTTASLITGQIHALRRRAFQAIDQLKTTDERYRQIVETADEGIWLLNASGNATYVNNRAAEMLGLSPEDLLGHSLGEFTYTPSGSDALASAIQPVQTGRSIRFDLRLRRSDGSLIWASVSASPVLCDEPSVAAGILAMLVDVTDRVLAEEHLCGVSRDFDASRNRG